MPEARADQRGKRLDEIKRKILPILKRHRAKRVGIFGSFARGDQRKDSDIDILVELDKDIDLLDFIGIQQELEDILGRKVDLVEYDTIKPLIKERILKEQVVLI
jgi:predicted nucleotidyltransferase